MGRPEMRIFGIPVGGAMDETSRLVANFTVGNNEGVAALEVAGGGFSARVEQAGWLAYSGAGDLYLTEKNGPVTGRLLYLPEATVFEIKATPKGSYGYLAAPGGWDVPQVLGSASTCTAGGFGGLEGRILAKGDVLKARGNAVFSAKQVPDSIWVSPRYVDLQQNDPAYLNNLDDSIPIRFLPGPEWEWWTPESQTIFCSAAFTVSRERDRMGVRLEGRPLPPDCRENLLSTGVSIGAVQVPPDGNPIVLLADAQTTGGYPRIGQVIAVDVGRLAQVVSGRAIRFIPVDLTEAEHLLFQQAAFLRQLAWGLRL